MNYFETVRPTYLENWSPALHKLSFPSIPVQLNLKEARALGADIVEWGNSFGARDMPTIENLRGRVDKAIRMFLPGGAFVRLGSRSPKDSWSGIRDGFRCTNGARAIAILTDCSERMHDDLRLAIAEKYAPTIWVREWVEPLGYEIRCFVKNRKFVGATQYDRKDVPGLDSDRRGVIEAIVKFIDTEFLPVCHLEDVVVDLAVARAGPMASVLMIEINPYFDMTDPLLFDWKNPEEMEAGYFRFTRDGVTISDLLAPPRKFSLNLEV